MTSKFGNTVVNGAVCQSNTECTVSSPAGAFGKVDITVSVNGLWSVPNPSDVFTYAYFPAITSVSPSSGPTAGGTKVTVTGTNFNSIPGSMTFMFGSRAATKVNCLANGYLFVSTQCTMTTPPWNGLVDIDSEVSVTATFSGMTSQTVGQFCYSNGGACNAPPPLPPPPKCIGTSCQ
jgi:hypothetical protein